MNVINISEVNNLKQLKIDDATSESDAEKSMLFLGTFNQCVHGMVNFMGKTPWEFHPDEEYLQVIDGSVEVTLLDNNKKNTISLLAGDTFIVPKEVWHRQFSEYGVKLLFITSANETLYSKKDDPRE